MTPTTVMIVAPCTGMSMSDSLASTATMPTVATIAISSRIGMKSSVSHALPPLAQPRRPAAAGDCDAVPVEEHKDEEKDRGDAGDLLSLGQPVQIHLHIPPWD